MPVLKPSPRGDAAPRSGRGRVRRSDRSSSGMVLDVSGTPVSRRRIRRTRIWMALLLLTPVCLAGISLLAFNTTGPPEPVVHPRSTPTGYRAITDAYFGYVVPSGFKQNTTWTDQNGDFFYGTPSAYVAETLLSPKHGPTAGSAPPPPFQAFGVPKPTPFSARGVHGVTVPGTHGAWQEQISRPGGFVATAVDAWEPATSSQIWLLVHAPPAVVRTVLASLKG